MSTPLTVPPSKSRMEILPLSPGWTCLVETEVVEREIEGEGGFTLIFRVQREKMDFGEG